MIIAFEVGGRARAARRFALVMVLLSGCATYRPRPLDEREIVRAEDAARRNPPFLTPIAESAPAGSDSRPGGQVGFRQVLAWLRESGPELREARAAWETAAAVARIPTPLPNPSLDAGFLYGTGRSVTTNAFQPQAALGMAIPLSGRLRLQDCLNRKIADAAWVEVVAKSREAYLGARQSFARLAMLRRREATVRELLRLSEQGEGAGRRLVEAGVATALDVGLFSIDRIRVEATLLDVESEVIDVQSDLSRRVGVHRAWFGGIGAGFLQPLPETLPDLQGLKDRLIATHPALARLRAQYAVAEAGLRLEVAKQYPDLRIGSSAEGDPGESKTTIGLTLGMDLPVFDRNQQGIARACRQREAVRRQYESAANVALAELERAFDSLGVALRKRKLMQTELLPRAESQMSLSLRLIEAGPGEALRILESQRSFRSASLDALEAEIAARRRVLDLEEKVGAPLFPLEEEDYR